MNKQNESVPGTIIWIAPFYNRSGYGVGARTTVASLHKAGLRIRIISVNEVEPGIDDCDLSLIQSLEKTQVILPITTIITHVPSKVWLDMKFPEPNVRIMDTTFDSSAQGNLPPAEWMAVCNEMDQVWLMTEQEREAFVSAGLPSEKIQFVRWPHPWMHNPLLPPPIPETTDRNTPFRFLSIAMFQPRRRWDTLIEAYLEEFRGEKNVELYLKVNYPSWHPVPGKPRQDFHNLVDSLRRKTGSQAVIIIDEALGTRKGIVRLIDSCNAYISTDTAETAPISEARVRQRMVIIPGDLGLGMPPDQIIEVDPNAEFLLTRDMLLYQPHHKGAFMPQLHVKDVRKAMRSVYAMPLDERQANSIISASFVPDVTQTVPEAIGAIKSAWQIKNEKDKNAGKETQRIVWEGSQFVYHSFALINRELCLKFIDAGYDLSIIPYEQHSFGPEVDTRFHKLTAAFNKKLMKPADVHVRHQWPPNFSPPPEGHWVMIQPWEYGALPRDWIKPMETQVDELWVPSNYVREVYIKSGISASKVFVIPNGVNELLFTVDAPKIEINTIKKTKFLFVGGTIRRKGINALLVGYTASFTSEDDVCLVIKDMGGHDFYKGQVASKQIAAIQANKAAPEIIYLTDNLNEKQMAGLYTACDCLIHPYRGEGFGLPVAEAMACGLPVVVTKGGACDDFCSEENAYLIDSSIKPIDMSSCQLISQGYVLEPDFLHLAKILRNIYENRNEASIKGRKAANTIKENFTWQNAANLIMDRLKILKYTPILRFQNQKKT